MPKMLGECDCDRECYEKGFETCSGPDPIPPPHKPNCPYACCVRPVTKKDAVEAHHGQVFYHRYARNADFTALRVRVTGRCKTWKTRPTEFRLPVKYGLYQSDANRLDERLGDLWSDMEIEERVGPRKVLSEEFGRLEERRKALTLKWLR